MTEQEIQEIFDKVTSAIRNSDSYHNCYGYGDEEWMNETTVLFTIYGHSDQGEGADWTENWSIDSEGKIHANGEVYENFEQFESEWVG